MRQPRFVRLLAAAAVSVAVALLVAANGPLGSDQAEQIAAAKRTRTILSEVYTIDQKYRSMMGPFSSQDVRLLDTEKPELLWITGYEAVMVGPDGESERAQAFMCHSNLDINAAAHTRLLGENDSFSPRLFTLSQGQFSIRFPSGYGIPLMSDETLDLTTQVLNLHLEGHPGLKVRHKVSLEFVRDHDVAGAMNALFPIAGYGLTLLDGDKGYFGEEKPDEEMHGPGCLPRDNASDHEYEDHLGRKFTGHWVVPPGREVNRTLVTQLMRVPYDTTVHYIAVHLHPFAESLELRDLTADRTVFKSEARNFEDHVGLAHVDYLASEDGLPILADHEYEIVSVYNNTSSEAQDSMAVMYIYLRDLEFDPRKARRQLRSADGSSEGRR